jgi:hypothetical protein
MTTTPEPVTALIERVARALFAAGFHPDELPAEISASWDEWREDREAAFRKANAAIIAINAGLSRDAERKIIGAIEAQFDIHAMEPEDWAEMHSAIRAALNTEAARSGEGELREALQEAVCLIPASQKTALAKFNALLSTAPLMGSGD